MNNTKKQRFDLLNLFIIRLKRGIYTKNNLIERILCVKECVMLPKIIKLNRKCFMKHNSTRIFTSGKKAINSNLLKFRG